MDLDCFCIDTSKICFSLLAIPGCGSININDHECVASLLLNRYHQKHNTKLISDTNLMSYHLSIKKKKKLMSIAIFFRALFKIEFEDVRKLASELCGRIHPQVDKVYILFLLLFKIVYSLLKKEFTLFWAM